MRLISQDGTIDVSYDSGSLTIGAATYEDIRLACIFYHNCSTQRGTKLAEYKSKEKAEKAMEMLHDSYIGKDRGYRDDNGGLLYRPAKTTDCNIFRFPKDEDLEE